MIGRGRLYIQFSFHSISYVYYKSKELLQQGYYEFDEEEIKDLGSYTSVKLVTSVVSKLLKEKDIKCTKVTIILPEDEVLTRFLDVPVMTKAESRKFNLSEYAVQKIRLPFKKPHIQENLLEESDTTKKYHLTITNNEILNVLIDVFRSLRYSEIQFDVVFRSLFRLHYQTKLKETELEGFIEFSNGTQIPMKKGQMVIGVFNRCFIVAVFDSNIPTFILKENFKSLEHVAQPVNEFIDRYQQYNEYTLSISDQMINDLKIINCTSLADDEFLQRLKDLESRAKFYSPKGMWDETALDIEPHCRIPYITALRDGGHL